MKNFRRIFILLIATTHLSVFAAEKEIIIPASQVETFGISVEAQKDSGPVGNGLLSNYYAVFNMKDGRIIKVLVGGEYRVSLYGSIQFTPSEVETAVARALNSGDPLEIHLLRMGGLSEMALQKTVITESLMALRDVRFGVCAATQDGHIFYQSTAFMKDPRNARNTWDCSKLVQAPAF